MIEIINNIYEKAMPRTEEFCKTFKWNNFFLKNNYFFYYLKQNLRLFFN